jgi:hypothetical protein
MDTRRRAWGDPSSYGALNAGPWLPPYTKESLLHRHLI